MIFPISSHDQLATFVQRNLFFFTVFGEKAIASPGKVRFKTIGRIVKSGVQDAAIPSARMQPAIRLLFYEMHGRIWECGSEPSRNVQANYAAADDEEISLHFHPLLPQSRSTLGLEEKFKPDKIGAVITRGSERQLPCPPHLGKRGSAGRIGRGRHPNFE